MEAQGSGTAVKFCLAKLFKNLETMLKVKMKFKKIEEDS